MSSISLMKNTIRRSSSKKLNLHITLTENYSPPIASALGGFFYYHNSDSFDSVYTVKIRVLSSFLGVLQKCIMQNVDYFT
jgi:hypothetical protein